MKELPLIDAIAIYLFAIFMLTMLRMWLIKQRKSEMNDLFILIIECFIDEMTEAVRRDVIILLVNLVYCFISTQSLGG